MSYPRTFSHLGINVADLERAVTFYVEVFGLYHLHGPQEFDEHRDRETTVGLILTETYGPGWGGLRVARLATADGIGIELQQFTGVVAAEGPPGTRRAGVSHFCVQDPDIEGLAERIVAHGGKRHTPVRDFLPGRKPFQLAYCEDPFGNLIEIDSHGFETTYSTQSYPEPSPSEPSPSGA